MRARGRLVAAACAAAMLAACEVPPAGTGDGVRSLALMSGAVRAQGPEGYCVDPAASRPDSGFAVMAGCALVSDDPAMPVLDGMLTVQFGAPGTASVAGAEQALRAVLQSAGGAAMLSRTGDAATVDLLRAEAGRGIVVVDFSDSAPDQVAGLGPREWRAFLDIDGRLATVTLRGFARAPLDRDAGRRLLSQAVSALRAANRTAV